MRAAFEAARKRPRKKITSITKSNAMQFGMVLWDEVFKDSDACVAPVLDFDEAPQHRQARARQAFIEVDGVQQPAPTPRFSRTAPARPTPPRPADNANLARSLEGWLDASRIAHWRDRGLLAPVVRHPA